MKLLRKLRALIFRSRLEREMAEEMRHHVETQAEAHRAQGIGQREADILARRQFRDMEQVKERCRDGRRAPWIEAWFQDLRQAARSLARAPGFSFVAVLTLALGIGANAQMFTVLRAFVLRTLPYPDGSRLVSLSRQNGNRPYAAAEMYRPLAQSPSSTVTLALRTRVSRLNIAPEIRRIAAELNAGKPVYGLIFVRDEADQELDNIRLARELVVSYAGLGLLLAGLGIYAVISNSVVQRTSEIGIRMALGAQVHDILALILGQGLRLTVIGIVAGLAGSFAVAAVLRSIMPELARADVPTTGSVILLFAIVATIACFLPARRAAKVDPMVALRAE